MHAEKCPICNGDGVTFPRDEGHYSIGYKVTCHGCNGLGWVKIDDEVSYKVPETTAYIESIDGPVYLPNLGLFY